MECFLYRVMFLKRFCPFDHLLYKNLSKLVNLLIDLLLKWRLRPPHAEGIDGNTTDFRDLYPFRKQMSREARNFGLESPIGSPWPYLLVPVPHNFELAHDVIGEQRTP